MLFPYKYVPHSMDTMHGYVEFIFRDVWCKAPTSGAFRLELFDDKPELKEVMEAFLISDTKGAYFFYGHIERVYGLFSTLDAPQISLLEKWFEGNNDIEKICANDPTAQVARYEDVTAMHKELSKQLASFFTGLYDKVDIADLRKKIGSIDDHYVAFMQVNGGKAHKCPFCGLDDLLGVNHTRREAYDHYLPKALYPFNSINFRNLVPACHHCNSSYKTSKDPTLPPKDPVRIVLRRKVFFPFATVPYSIDIEVDFSTSAIDNLSRDDVHLHFGPAELTEEIETWKYVYGIEERYKAKCVSGDAKDWLEQVRILDREHGIANKQAVQTIAEQATQNPFSNSNFLKKAFLQACERRGLFVQAQAVASEVD